MQYEVYVQLTSGESLVMYVEAKKGTTGKDITPIFSDALAAEDRTLLVEDSQEITHVIPGRNILYVRLTPLKEG